MIGLHLMEPTIYHLHVSDALSPLEWIVFAKSVEVNHNKYSQHSSDPCCSIHFLCTCISHPCYNLNIQALIEL